MSLWAESTVAQVSEAQPGRDAVDGAIAEALAARDPANTQWQPDLSVSHDRIGDVLVAQGDGPAALAAYRRGLAIAGLPPFPLRNHFFALAGDEPMPLLFQPRHPRRP